MKLRDLLRKYARQAGWTEESENVEVPHESLAYDLQDDWRERTSIMEFEGGLTRERADSEALDLVLNESSGKKASGEAVKSQNAKREDGQSECDDHPTISTEQRVKP